jgi:L-arabinose isomerase
MLASCARNLAEAAGSGIEATAELGWIDTSWSVGDLVERIEGHNLTLAGRVRSQPSVSVVNHEFGKKQQTQLIITG